STRRSGPSPAHRAHRPRPSRCRAAPAYGTFSLPPRGYLTICASAGPSVPIWICRPRPLWRTNVAARRFAVGRYAISVDTLTRTAIVWMESRKVGQYDARELSLRWPGPTAPAGQPDAGQARVAPPRRAGGFKRPTVELLWDSPAAVGHNRQIVMRAPLATEGDRVAVLALDAALRQIV
ncbi:hypothetical protein OIV82_30875, partial [Burkholderia pseudomallei]|nr:hypothetical protein [Burkholderia pseudomallei]